MRSRSCSTLTAKAWEECFLQIVISSALGIRSRGSKWSRRVLIITLNRIGLITLRWGQPLSSLCWSEFSSPTRTWIFLSSRKLWVHLSILPFMLNLSSFIIVPIDHMRSNAFSIYKNTAATSFFSMKAIWISDSNRVSWSFADLPGLKPDWVFARWFYFPSVQFDLGYHDFRFNLLCFIYTVESELKYTPLSTLFALQVHSFPLILCMWGAQSVYFNSDTIVIGPRHEKTCLCHMRTTKTQITSWLFPAVIV